MPNNKIIDETLHINTKLIDDSYWYILKVYHYGYINLCISKDKNKLIEEVSKYKEYDKFLIAHIKCI
jgi:hypothetical protein